MLFLIFSFLISCCALLQNKAKAIALLLIICISLPTGHSYSKVISINGVYFYDFFTAIYFVVSIYRAFNQKNNFTINNIFSVFAIIANVVLLVASLLFGGVDKFFIKDVRPILNLLFFVAATDLFFRAKVVFHDNSISALVLLSAASTLGKYLLIYNGFYGFQDEYYETNSYRYIDGTAYFCAIYLIFAYFSKDDVNISFLRLLSIVSAISVVLLANSRFIVFGILLCILIYDTRSIKSFFYAIFMSIFVFMLFIIVSSQVGAERIVENMSFDGVIEQFEVRFSPAMELIEKFGFLEFLFGKGAGTYFVIPWFEYRGLEVMHSNIDSAYFTYYVKYGLIGFVLLYFYTKIFIINSVYALFYRIFLGVIYFVEAAHYQPFMLGFLATLVCSSFGGGRERRNQ